LELNREEAIVTPDHRGGGNIGPRRDVAWLAECNIGLMARIDKDSGGVLGCQVVEKVGCHVEVDGVPAGRGGGDPRVDGSRRFPPASWRLSRVLAPWR
jgi:hypothetical protein